MDGSKAYILPTRDQRPVKRRRLETSDKNLATHQLNTYRLAWGSEEGRLIALAHEFYKSTIGQVTSFVHRERLFKECVRIPTGLIVSGPGASSQGYIFEGLRDAIVSDSECIYVSLAASDAPNLKTLLRTIIKRATSAVDDSDDENLITSTKDKGFKLLSYDLQILHDFTLVRNIQRIVLSLRDFEAFDVAILSDALQLLVSWLDRLPLICILGVATSVDNLDDRLPQMLVKCCLGETFEVVDPKDVIESVFRRSNDAQALLRLGPRLAETIMQKQREQGYNVLALVRTFQYCYMSHFFGNSLSLMLSTTSSLKRFDADIAQSIRHLPSFRQHVNDLADAGNTLDARRLLDSDKALLEEVRTHISAGRTSIKRTLCAIKIFEEISRCLEIHPTVSFSMLYIKAFSGELLHSTLLRELLLFVRRASSDSLTQIFSLVVHELEMMPPSNDGLSSNDFCDLQDQLRRLLQIAGKTEVLRSEHDLKNETYRTTVVAHRVELSRQKSQLSKSDTVYSELISSFHNLLSNLFKETLRSTDELFLNEILFYDLKAPYRDTFAPRPRAALERALSKPHDYLGCSCCEVGQGSLAPSQPPTAILFQLYLESGALINSFDLWNAFRAVVGDRHDDEHVTMALFFRGLSELKRAGYIKPSRKKADHFAKVAWIGM